MGGNSYQRERPIVLLGAGRSGTNMLRDVLCRLPGLGTWPCDEINYIWRHGNARFPTDEFGLEQARPEVAAFIRREFDRMARRYGLSRVVEKTCANTLRVGFVDAVFPQAQFIHLIRDGRDVALSAAKRWQEGINLRYTLEKARYVPLADVPYYATRFIYNHARRLVSQEKRLSFWGPLFTGMADYYARLPLVAACAVQWRHCVDAAEDYLDGLDSSRVFRVKYEDFTANPAGHLAALADFLEVEATEELLAAAVTSVNSLSVGRWRQKMDNGLIEIIEGECGGTFSRTGYPVH